MAGAQQRAADPYSWGLWVGLKVSTLTPSLHLPRTGKPGGEGSGKIFSQRAKQTHWGLAGDSGPRIRRKHWVIFQQKMIVTNVSRE